MHRVRALYKVVPQSPIFYQSFLSKWHKWKKSREYQLIVCSVRKLGIFRRQTWLMRALDFKIAAGECWLLTGQNGSGKTTLLRTLAGLCIPDEGEICYPNTADNDFRPLY